MATFPAWSNAELRPSRRASASCGYSPSVIAATAGPNTSPTTPIAVFAVSTGQNAGQVKIATAPAASTASETTTSARLARVASISAPAGVCATSASNPLTVVTAPTLDWLQCMRVIRNTFRYGPSAPRTSASRKFTASSAAPRRSRALSALIA
jgi:hypothetical protein